MYPIPAPVVAALSAAALSASVRRAHAANQIWIATHGIVQGG